MKRGIGLAIAVAMALPCTAPAQVAISPAAPAMLDSVRLQVTSSGPMVYDIDGTKISMSDNVIDVTLRTGPFLSPAPPTRTNEFFLGQFPAGSYLVNVALDNGIARTAVGSASFTVTSKPASSTAPVADFSDLWWNPQQSGWGLNIIQHASGNLFVTWFAYRGDGQPFWYVVPGGTWTQGRIFRGDLYRVTGPVVGDTFDASRAKATLAGTATLQFDPMSRDFGSVNLQVDGVAWGSMIKRQPF